MAGLENVTSSAIYEAHLDNGDVLHLRKFTINDLGRREAFIKEQRFDIRDKLAAVVSLTAELKEAVSNIGQDEAMKVQLYAIMLGAVKDGVQESLGRPRFVTVAEETEFSMSRLGVAYDLHLVCEEITSLDEARMLIFSASENELREIIEALDKAKEREAIKNSGSPSNG